MSDRPTENSADFRNNNGSEENRENRSIQINDPKQKQQPPKRATIPKDKGETRRPAPGITTDLKEDSSRQELRRLLIPEDRGLVKQKVLVEQEKFRETFISLANQEAAVNKQRMPVSGPGKPSKLISEQQVGTESKPKQIRDNSTLRKKPSGAMQDVSFAGFLYIQIM